MADGAGSRWSKAYVACVSCGGTDRRHAGKGLCFRCYSRTRDRAARPKTARSTLGKVTIQLTEQVLREEYYAKGLSLEEIGIKYGCTRQYVAKRMKILGLERRDHSRARRRAAAKGLVPGCSVNRRFFREWGQEMAYVLGIIYTDGCLHETTILDTKGARTGTSLSLSLAQKEPELLDKVSALMKCDAKLRHSPRRAYESGIAGEVYRFNLADQAVCQDLLRLGVTPRKSRRMRFPAVPDEFLRHFIRGCWDGDGSVYSELGKASVIASYTSGSQRFVVDLMDALCAAGLRRPRFLTLTRRTRAGGLSESYYFKYYGKDVAVLHDYLYDGVPPSQYLSRKKRMFARAAERWAESKGK